VERATGPVDPTQFYSHEPAPMGIADFGVTGPLPGASAYEYSSSSFQGEATVGSLSVSISGSSSKVTAFELNAVLLLERNGSNYSYWIQNGLHLDAVSHEFTIGGAYVWNFSSPTAKISPGEVTGASGSVLSGDTYYDIPSCGPAYPGQCSTLALPATLTGRIVSATSAGVPYVAYEYNIGAGWVVYDNVSFGHLAGSIDAGFHVDGFTPTPYSSGLYYDAEWDWVGAGGGSASVDQGSDIGMSLDLWNGHNYQAVPCAWNFGSNTGETSSNVSDLSRSLGDGSPAAHLVSGAGTLGLLYNQSDVGSLNVTVPTRMPGTLQVDGGAVPFQGGGVNLTLSAGLHSIYLQNFTNASAQVEVAAGTTSFVNLSGAGRVAFTESGLPLGAVWGVSIGGTNLSSAGTTILVNLPNGTYAVGYSAVPGYHRTGSAPSSLSVPGTAEVAIHFTVFTYAVGIFESGLPDSTLWWVDLNGTRLNSTGPAIQVSVPNGTTPFTVGSSYEFVAVPAGGVIPVVGGVASPVDVAFSYRPTFIEGTVVPSDAQVTIGGLAQPLASGVFNDSVIPGTYSLVASAPGFVSQSLPVTATAGNVTWANITLRANQTPAAPPSGGSSTGGGIGLTTAILVIVGVLVAVVAILVLVARKR